MESLARKYWKDKDKIAKLTSYGSYLDCEYITAKYPEDESHIVGDLAEYVYDLEQEVEKLTKSFAYKNNEDLSTTINGVKFTSEQIIALQQVGYSAEYDRNQTAIAELEKVKEWANNMYDGWKSNDGVNLDAKSGICNTLQAVCGMVNQQIKSLKGEGK